MNFRRFIDSLIPAKVKVPQFDREMEVWEPPFEHWQRLADDILRDWPSAQPPRENRV